MKQQVIRVGTCIFIATQSFIFRQPGEAADNTGLLPQLSGYHIYGEHAASLTPQKEYIPYDVATPLFSDYAEKARLVSVPAGLKITVTSSGLPQFPEGTRLVKTFFYWNDKRDTSKGRTIIETRMLIKSGAHWQAGTYVWNREQTDAVLVSGGQKQQVSWIDETGKTKNISYQVPSGRQCGSCHGIDGEINPVSFKIRNLNRMATRNGATTNQLTLMNEAGIMNEVTPGSFAALPDWNDSSFTLEQRARAYLDVNCANCHNEKGSCSRVAFRPAYEKSFSESNIKLKGKRIVRLMQNGRMPYLGTTIVHKEGLALIAAYVKSLE